MKRYIQTIFIYSAYLFLLSVFVSCTNREVTSDHSHEEVKPATLLGDHEEGVGKIVALSQAQMRTVGVTLGSVAYKELTDVVRANGLLNVPNNNKANATSLYGGVISTLNVHIGDYVKKGQTIATITNPLFIQVQEEFLTIDSRINMAELEYQRQKSLYEGNAGSGKNLQSATTELSTLQTRKASLQKQLQLMGINPNSITNGNLQAALVVRSPLSGNVSNLFAKIGSYVDVSSPVIEVVDNSSLHLDLQVFEKDLPKIKIGQTIHFTLTNNPTTEYDATIFSIGSSFENDSKTVAVHARVIGNTSGLIDGMNATGIVSLNNKKTPAVPNEAIVNADGKYYVFVVTHKTITTHPHESEVGHNHSADETDTHKDESGAMSFERVEVLKGVSDMGYTGVVFTNDIPERTKIVVKGAFFINAKLSNTGEHEH